jgi:hypothetical protein
VELGIYDINGRLVRSLLDGEAAQTAGGSVLWDGTSAAGTPVASGIYFYRLRVGQHEVEKKLQILR